MLSGQPGETVVSTRDVSFAASVSIGVPFLTTTYPSSQTTSAQVRRIPPQTESAARRTGAAGAGTRSPAAGVEKSGSTVHRL